MTCQTNKFNKASKAKTITAIFANDSLHKGLYLHVRLNKQGINKAFIFRYKANNKVFTLTIEHYPHISLDKARDITTQYNAILQSLEYIKKRDKTFNLLLLCVC
ncbi:MAG: Arm DNA-binding domain-containing protein [Helicobacter sp.]|uniref:Arm DNA-binding domain-containing protein n=1 Tax=Helicobacter sp. TaxID=218 RepID=UPI002A917F1B|nr:Arm DNA-binding domain-containing protein [Helicobacter sp.]MDY5823116.1 Arm DNA-binding domain-containing protein [Helicobacter sp.]